MAETVEKSKIRRLKEFIHRLQRLEDGQKKKWLIGLTALAMIFFVGLWLVYLSTIGLPTIAVKTKLAVQTETAVGQSDEESFWKIFQRGWREISGQAKENFDKAQNLINQQIEKSNEIILNNNTSTLTATTTANATTTQ